MEVVWFLNITGARLDEDVTVLQMAKMKDTYQKLP